MSKCKLITDNRLNEFQRHYISRQMVKTKMELDNKWIVSFILLFYTTTATLLYLQLFNDFHYILDNFVYFIVWLGFIFDIVMSIIFGLCLVLDVVMYYGRDTLPTGNGAKTLHKYMVSKLFVFKSNIVREFLYKSLHIFLIIALVLTGWTFFAVVHLFFFVFVMIGMRLYYYIAISYFSNLTPEMVRMVEDGPNIPEPSLN